MVYLGVRQTLNYASTSRSHALARKWLIENCALVDHRHLTQLHEHGINPQNVSALVHDISALKHLLDQVTLTHLTFGHLFDRRLDYVTLPPT